VEKADALAPHLVNQGRMNLSKARERQSPHAQAVKEQLTVFFDPSSSLSLHITKVQACGKTRVLAGQRDIASASAMQDTRTEGVAKPPNAGKNIAFQPFHAPARHQMKFLALQGSMVAAPPMSLPLALVQCDKMAADARKQSKSRTSKVEE
jgi:hypothetical protein